MPSLYFYYAHVHSKRHVVCLRHLPNPVGQVPVRLPGRVNVVKACFHVHVPRFDVDAMYGGVFAGGLGLVGAVLDGRPQQVDLFCENALDGCGRGMSQLF